MAETFAVLNGRTPLVDFHSQYAQLVPYLAAGGAADRGHVGRSVDGNDARLQRTRADGRLRGTAASRAQLARRAGAVRALPGRHRVPDLRSPEPAGDLQPVADALRRAVRARLADGAPPRRRRAPSTLVAARRGRLVGLNNLEFGLPAAAGALVAIAYADPPRSSGARCGWSPTRRLGRSPRSSSWPRSRSCTGAHCRGSACCSSSPASTASAAGCWSRWRRPGCTWPSTSRSSRP